MFPSKSHRRVTCPDLSTSSQHRLIFFTFRCLFFLVRNGFPMFRSGNAENLARFCAAVFSDERKQRKICAVVSALEKVRETHRK